MSFTYLSHSPGSWGRTDGLDLELFHEQVDHEGPNGETYCCIMDLFKIFTQEEDVNDLRQISSKVIICGIDMEVLWDRKMSCRSLL